MGSRSVRRLQPRWALLVSLLAFGNLGIAGCEEAESTSEAPPPEMSLDQDQREASWWITEFGEAPEDALSEHARDIFANLRPVFDDAGSRLVILESRVSLGSSPFAAALPDGSVLVNRAGLELCFRGVSEERGMNRLALVLAHELAHLQADHQWYLDAKAMALAFDGEDKALRSLSATLREAEPSGKMLELDADRRAVIGMAIAGFDPDVIFGEDESFFEEWTGSPMGQLAYQDDSHPSPEARVANATVRLRSARAKAAVFDAGTLAYRRGDFEEAIDAFEEVRQVFPSREVLSNLGLSHYQLAALALSDCDGMLVTTWRLPVRLEETTILHRAINRGSERSHCYEIADYERHLEAAVRYLEGAWEIDHEYVTALEHLLATHMLDDRPFMATSYAEAAIRLKPDDPELQMSRLVVRLADEQSRGRPFDDYLADLVDLHRRHPENTDIAFNTGQALWIAGEFDRAEATWRRFLELEPDTAWAGVVRSRLRLDEPAGSASDQPAR